MAFQKPQYFTKEIDIQISDNARSQYTQHLRGSIKHESRALYKQEMTVHSGSVQSQTRHVVPLFP